jgi:PIN domain nuclease of toxin-antitoxin system
MARAPRISAQRLPALADSALLLDTHTFAWWLGDPERLGRAARAAIAAPGSKVFVSVASVWEMTLKHRRGRWPEIAAIVADPGRHIAAEDMTPMTITLAHAHTAGLLDWAHGDPFDRMLAAQAIVEGALLVTADRVFASLPLATLWD